MTSAGRRPEGFQKADLGRLFQFRARPATLQFLLFTSRTYGRRLRLVAKFSHPEIPKSGSKRTNFPVYFWSSGFQEGRKGVGKFLSSSRVPRLGMDVCSLNFRARNPDVPKSRSPEVPTLVNFGYVLFSDFNFNSYLLLIITVIFFVKKQRIFGNLRIFNGHLIRAVL